jgi:molybdopterin synthase sulfur carrier subunit
MSLNIKYFGRIVEVTGLSEEQMDLNDKMDLKEFKEILQLRYPNLKDESYQIAVNQELRTETFIINPPEVDEIAILPPFAGG